ncbi:CHASE3 domain-containing protein [Legionella maceachernii]|uniref:histidine kinase n=1 Tax=Legionella maceachernii TaxID=466 RepID=A0A0W0W6K0_9GAMM|nr:CHASE3 domain-containing protein [Legionella maceachernii]KTD27961.1 two-component sensor histidine kinase [Legionella maceachernii]SKA26082.1 PAS domain S-box-containing protein [Legionella maceachernii]SUO99965.1 Phytochrome-like protein cph1 [Legionella maceachernii]
MKLFSSPSSIRAFSIISILLILIISGVIYFQIYRLIDENAWVFHTHKTIETAEKMMINVNTLENMQRDYLITGNKNRLDGYNALIQQIQQNVKEFTALTADNPLQQNRISNFSQLFEEYVKLLNQSIQARKQNGMQAGIAIVATDNVKWMTNQLTQHTSQIIDEERKLLDVRNQVAFSSESRTITLALLANLAAIGLLTLCFYWLNKNVNEKTILEERLRIFMNSSKNYGFLILNPEGYIVNWNLGAEHITGYTEKEAIGKHFSILFPEDKVKENYPAKELQLALERDFFEVDDWFIRKNGQSFWGNTIIRPMYSHQSLIGFGKIIRDMTDNKKTNDELKMNIQEKIKINEQLNTTLDELQRSNTDLEQFAYIASHDLQEPLRVISNYTKLLEKRYKNRLDDDADDFINYIVDGAKRMQQLITDLLAYSRVTTKAKPCERVDPNLLLDDILAGLKELIHEKDVTIKYDKLPMVWADPSQLRQVFQNLIANGIKFCTQKPVITITGKKENDCITFCVEDNGIGIAPEYQERVFEIFKRLHTRDQYPGTGIGLAVCKKIITQHGGDIWIESALGEGSKFFFTCKHQGEHHGTNN